eukprot:7403576-Pyramimonas_sp.AAC.1
MERAKCRRAATSEAKTVSRTMHTLVGLKNDMVSTILCTCRTCVRRARFECNTLPHNLSSTSTLHLNSSSTS